MVGLSLVCRVFSVLVSVFLFYCWLVSVCFVVVVCIGRFVMVLNVS